MLVKPKPAKRVDEEFTFESSNDLLVGRAIQLLVEWIFVHFLPSEWMVLLSEFQRNLALRVPMIHSLGESSSRWSSEILSTFRLASEGIRV